MAKRVAVVILRNQAEGLRVSGGISVLGEDVTVFVLDRALADEREVTTNLDMVREVGLPVFTNVVPPGEFTLAKPEEIAERLMENDVVLTF